jgi:hypothetical protein
MMADISVQPPVLNLSFYAGDGLAFRLICNDETDEPIDVSGVIEAQIRLDRLMEDPPIVEFSSDLTNAANGIVVLSLTGEQTQQLIDHPSTKKGKFTGVWDTQWLMNESEPRTLCQGKVECLADVTR